jgi:hypothetical protein
MTHKIAILIPYFGKWPEWIDFFIESCRANSDIDWFLIGDAERPQNRAPNVRHVRTSMGEYRDLLSQRLGKGVTLGTPYKICDLRPALPFVHADIVSGYDFAGFGDLDVIYGDIRSFYDSDLLDRYDLLSSHADRVSGHLCLIRNTPEMITAFERAPGWKAVLRTKENLGWDERGLFNLFRGKQRRWLARRLPDSRCLFREAYSTPAPTDRMRWYWKDGRLTNEFYPQHAFMYLHFMSWQGNRWYEGRGDVAPGAEAPWTKLPKVVQMDWRSARGEGFMISPQGIQPIKWPLYE